jgi:hypothetical protein
MNGRGTGHQGRIASRSRGEDDPIKKTDGLLLRGMSNRASTMRENQLEVTPDPANETASATRKCAPSISEAEIPELDPAEVSILTL